LFLVGIRPFAHVCVQGDSWRGVAKGELYPLDTRAVLDEPGSEVVAKAVQADAFGKTRNLSARHPDVCPARTVQRTAPSGSENQIGGTDVMLSLIRVGAVPDLDFNRRVDFKMAFKAAPRGHTRRRRGRRIGAPAPLPRSWPLMPVGWRERQRPGPQKTGEVIQAAADLTRGP